MYKVFVKEIPIIVTTCKEQYPDHKVFNLKQVNFEKLVRQIADGKYTKVLLYSKKEKKLLPRLHKKLPLVIAGGGLVINPENDYLFIHRKGKWDLPKGKAEKGETIEQTALREVEEETGARGLSIAGDLGRTYHVYSWRGKLKLKLTHWFLMETTKMNKLKPQKKEGIDKAVWLDKKMTQVALSHSYANIKELFPDEMLLNKRG